MPITEFYLGNSVVIEFSFAEIPETVTAKARQSDAALADAIDLTVVPGNTALKFSAEFTPTVAGRWYVQIEATGTNASSQEVSFDVLPFRAVDEGALVTPFVSDVAKLLRARTKETETGAELGTFTAKTRPTDDEVVGLIEIAYTDVITQTGVHVAPRYADAAKSLIALRTAMLVELSYWPEQVKDSRSPYEEYRKIYEERIAALLAAIAGDAALGGPDGIDRFGTLRLRSPFAWPREDFWPEPENPFNWPDPFHAPGADNCEVGDQPTSGDWF